MTRWVDDGSGSVSVGGIEEAGRRFTACMIGSGTLPVRCGERLLERGHTIGGVIAGDDVLFRWAVARGIRTIRASEDIETFVGEVRHEYLFSIVNLALLSGNVLSRPSRWAINYHDGPLPKFAGVHATSWALINREATHGITWHLMSKDVDGGDVLVQRAVSIEASDTALSLNLKCHEAAFGGFGDLVDGLAAGHVVPRPQDLKQRTYFSRYKRPGSVLSLTQASEEVDALARGLLLGPYDNAIGVPKVIVAGKPFIAGSVALAGDASLAPGTVCAVDSDALTIAGSTRNIVLGQFATLEGRPVATADLVRDCNIRVGSTLLEPAQQALEAVRHWEQKLAPHEAFWVGRLAELTPLNIPYAMTTARTESDGYYEEMRIAVPPTLPCELGEGRSHAVLTALLVYLARIADSVTFDVATPVSPDVPAGVAQLVASHVPVRVDLDFDAPFEVALDAVRRSFDEADRRSTHLRDVRARYPQLRAAASKDLSAMRVVVGRRICSVEPKSSLLAQVSNDGDECRWVFDTRVFSQEAVVEMTQGALALLMDVLTTAGRPIGAATVLSPPAQAMLLKVNDTTTDAGVTQCVHELFEAQVARTPEAVALVVNGDEISYRELDRRAGHVADWLRQAGIGPENLVGLCAERSAEMVVGMLGVWKAGGAYIPLDPELPAERLNFMVTDARVGYVLATVKTMAIAQSTGARAVDITTLRRAPDGAERPVVGGAPENLAYVIYTSGSTGVPKGVEICHRSVVNLLKSLRERPGICAQDRMLAITTMSFDIAVLELFLPLSVGARVVIASGDDVREPRRLMTYLDEAGVTIMQATPTTWRLLLEAGWAGCPGLKVLCGGEPISLVLAEQLIGRAAEVWNLYGPTETTVWSTVGRLELGARQVSAGRPIANTQVHILDQRGRPVPPGISGDLYIGGLGVARGYLNRPDLTTARFTADGGARLYHTGDIARWLADGTIELLGRSDHQVKVRGFRIELGEIEARLDRHPGVQASVVHPESDGENVRLIAYVKPRVAGDDAVSRELRSFLLTSLPEYMVPSAFVAVDEFPRTANGKIDRGALAALSPAPRRERATEAEGTRTETESAIAEIWRSVLDVDFVGMDENFFDLGGNSLLIERVRSGLVERFDVDLAVVSMFEYPTVRAIARMISAARLNSALAAADSERAQHRHAGRRARQDIRRRLDLGRL